MEQRVSFITLGVADLKASSAFYKRLGWKPASSPEDIVFFQAGPLVLALYSRAALAEDAGVPNTKAGGFSGVTLAHNVRSETEADALMEEAKAAGAKVVKLMQKVFWGGYSGYFADPDGHLWEVCYNPFAVLTEDGALHLNK